MVDPDEIEIEISSTEEEKAPTPPEEDARSQFESEEAESKRLLWKKRWVRLKEKTTYNGICWTVGIIAVFSLLFVSDHSIWSMIRREHSIRQVEAQKERYQERIQEIEFGLETLQNTDSLEKYAREKYYMHAPNEDVYLIREK